MNPKASGLTQNEVDGGSSTSAPDVLTLLKLAG